MALSADESARLDVIAHKVYPDQACFFLNAFWNELSAQAEEIWVFWGKIKDLDKMQYNALPEGKKAETYSEGFSLDEFWSHKFLENIGKTMSIVEFRTEFKKIDANTDKRMGLLEFLIYHYNLSVKELLARPQGGDPEEIKHAQNLVAQVAAAFSHAQDALDKASKTEEEAKKTAAAAVKSEAEAKKTAAEAAETAISAAASAGKAKATADEASATAAAASSAAAAAAAAAAEQQAAVDALKLEEDTYNAKTKDLESKSEAGGVSGMRAKNELAQHLGEDPLPLRKAKLTAEAAAKKTDKANQTAQSAKDAADKAKAIADADAKAAQKAKIVADEAKAAADDAAAAAEKDRLRAQAAAAEAEKDRLAAEAAVRDAEVKLAEAEAYLEEVKSKSDQTYGTFWWINRELEERKKYMPKTGKAKLLF